MRLGLSGVMIVVIASVAVAQDAPLIGPETLKVFPRGEERCFAGIYDAAYRKTHPGQTLTQFWLYRHFQQNHAKEDPGQTPAEWIAEDLKPDTPGWVDVLANFSDMPGSFRQTVTCNDRGKGGMHCFVECDGGSFMATSRGAGLAVSFDPEYGAALSMNQGCGDPDEDGRARQLTAKDAGGGFEIAAVPAAQCIAADTAAHPAFAADPVPLRERLREPGFRCLARTYDKAHLKKHPKQQVVAIAVAVKSAPHTVQERDMRPAIALDLRLSLRLRNGKTAVKDLECRADEYQFRCGGEFRLRRRDATSATLLTGEYGGSEAPETPTLAGLEVGRDDGEFRLDVSAGAACAAE